MIFWSFIGNFSLVFWCFFTVLLYFWPFFGRGKAIFGLFSLIYRSIDYIEPTMIYKSVLNDNFWSLGDHCWKSSSRLPDRSSGVQNKQLGRAEKMGKKENEKTIFKGLNFGAQKAPFFYFLENFQNRRFWSAKFFVKKAPKEKTECTTMTGTENARKLSSQIFYFQTFVTEIFCFKVRHFSYFFKTSKNPAIN